MQGISSKSAGSLTNKLKYNGKEEQKNEFSDGSGLDWMDYGARMYDGQIGRWGAKDINSENYFNYSPYSYCINNPINFIDPDGKDVVFDITRNKEGEITGIVIRATIFITGDGATEKKATSLNKDFKSQYHSKNVDGVSVKFDVTYKYSKDIKEENLSFGENILNFISKTSVEHVEENASTEGRDVSHVESKIEVTGGNKYKFSGRYGEIYKQDWNSNHSIFHETFHELGLSDRYIGDHPLYGWPQEIMSAPGVVNLTYSHYADYYETAKRFNAVYQIISTLVGGNGQLQISIPSAYSVDSGAGSWYNISTASPYKNESMPKKSTLKK